MACSAALAASSAALAARLTSIFLANVIQPPRSTRGPDRSRQRKNALGRQPILVINASRHLLARLRECDLRVGCITKTATGFHQRPQRDRKSTRLNSSHLG